VRIARLGGLVVLVVLVVLVMLCACRSRSPSTAAPPSSDAPPAAAGSAASAKPAAPPMRWQLDRFVVEAGPPPGWVVSEVAAALAPRVEFADPAGRDHHRSTITLSSRCQGPCEAGELVANIAQATAAEGEQLGGRWERELEEIRPGVWVARMSHARGTRIMVSHVVAGATAFLYCMVDVDPSAHAQVAALEQFCTALSPRVEASGTSIEHALGGHYELGRFEVIIPELLEWSFERYKRRWASLTFQREADPIGYTAHLRLAPTRIRAATLEADVVEAAELDAKRDSRFEWIQRPLEQRPGLWSYAMRLSGNEIDTILIQVAAARGDDALWCRVELRRPEDQAMATAMQTFCIERVAAATAL
jgi:hypothetical protein